MTKDDDHVEIDVIALPCWWVTLPPRPLTGGVRQTQLPPLCPLCPPCPLPSHLFPHLISCGVAIFTMNINIGEPIFLTIIVYSYITFKMINAEQGASEVISETMIHLPNWIELRAIRVAEKSLHGL